MLNPIPEPYPNPNPNPNYTRTRTRTTPTLTPTKELEKTVAQAVEAIRAQASWRVRDDAGVKAWAASR